MLGRRGKAQGKLQTRWASSEQKGKTTCIHLHHSTVRLCRFVNDLPIHTVFIFLPQLILGDKQGQIVELL